jgi:hypothetical protein
MRRLAALVAATVLLSGCGAAGEANPEKIGPQGVDELTIPTPTPDPTDFVDTVDNPWLPLTPGRVWTYDVSGSAATRSEVTVASTPTTIDGVSCVVVHTVATDDRGRTLREEDAYFAQDRRGNVWLMGEEGEDRSWRAGEDGAQAGLAMPATPRVGDGYAMERVPGVAQDRATVLSVGAESSVPAGTFAGTLVIETRAEEGDPDVTRRSYAAGTGLVEALTTLGGTEHAELAGVR